MLTDTALHFTLLSGKDHNKKNQENQIFETMETFDNNEDVVDFVDDGNIFDYFDNDEKFFQNIDFEDDSDISSVLIGNLKSNYDDNDGLVLFNVKTVEVLRKLYESFEKQEVSLDEVCNHPVISGVGDIVGNLKFVLDVSRTGKLWLQFKDFVSVIRMFIPAERTGNFELHISSSEQMLPYFAAAGHDKYTVTI